MIWILHRCHSLWNQEASMNLIFDVDYDILGQQGSMRWQSQMTWACIRKKYIEMIITMFDAIIIIIYIILFQSCTEKVIPWIMAISLLFFLVEYFTKRRKNLLLVLDIRAFNKINESCIDTFNISFSSWYINWRSDISKLFEIFQVI